MLRSLFCRSSLTVKYHNLVARSFSTASGDKLVAPPMVFIKGEEMTRYCMQLILDEWIHPRFDTSSWDFYDLSCVSRDNTEDKVLHDAVAAGKRIGAIFKEPTITPTEVQKEKLGLKKAWGSPNGAMRRGWNGITISRDTIHIDGLDLGFKRPVLFERHAVGGEYSAGWAAVGKGQVTTMFHPQDGSAPSVIDNRHLTDNSSVVVSYDNPLDNVTDLAHHFFSRCLEADDGAGVVPYVVTKKTVFKWQEGFWVAMKEVFDKDYKDKFSAKGLLKDTNGELQHLISDAATMQIIRWTGGGFGMAAHNYDGDMLTDEVAQVHRSPGFITSNLIGKNDDGTMIKEYEASHGTVADLWEAHQRGEETSFNPLGMVEALIGAMNHAADLSFEGEKKQKIHDFTGHLRKTMHELMVEGKGTRDLCGPSGLSTEEFVKAVSDRLDSKIRREPSEKTFIPVEKGVEDIELVQQLFDIIDTDGNGTIDFNEFRAGLRRIGVEPRIAVDGMIPDRATEK